MKYIAFPYNKRVLKFNGNDSVLIEVSDHINLLSHYANERDTLNIPYLANRIINSEIIDNIHIETYKKWKQHITIDTREIHLKMTHYHSFK